MPAPPRPCPACGADGPPEAFVAREMMFGTREPFTYLECPACGCVRIAEVPDDLGAHYPDGYYSFGAPPTGRLQRLAKRQRLRHALGLAAPGGAALTARYGPSPIGAWLAPLGLPLDADVLEVGCGAGHLLFELRDAGFTSLVGVDPFTPRAVSRRGVRVLRRSVHEVEGAFDLVMFHHTFEHLPDPAETLGQAARLTRPGGRVLLRVPVADSFAFRTYGADWVQLDAPRHLFLHTRASIGHLAERAGLALASVEWDSSALQFWGSEQYRRDVPLFDPSSHAVDPATSAFSADVIADYQAQAEALNRAGDGDQAVFTLVREG